MARDPINQPSDIADPAAPLGTPQAGSPRVQEARFERRRGNSTVGWVIAIILVIGIAAIIWGYSKHQPTVAANNPPAVTGAVAPGLPNRPTPSGENTGSR
jgi:hypothetical protein